MTGPRPEFLQAVDAIRPSETTKLGPKEEAAFRLWAQRNKLNDIDHQATRYDYRGAYKAGLASEVHPSDGLPHWPDTFKQHGHPTFSRESKYSMGPGDGGTWRGEEFTAPTSRDTLNTIKAIRRKLGGKNGR